MPWKSAASLSLHRKPDAREGDELWSEDEGRCTAHLRQDVEEEGGEDLAEAEEEVQSNEAEKESLAAPSDGGDEGADRSHVDDEEEGNHDAERLLLRLESNRGNHQPERQEQDDHDSRDQQEDQEDGDGLGRRQV